MLIHLIIYGNPLLKQLELTNIQKTYGTYGEVYENTYAVDNITN